MYRCVDKTVSRIYTHSHRMSQIIICGKRCSDCSCTQVLSVLIVPTGVHVLLFFSWRACAAVRLLLMSTFPDLLGLLLPLLSPTVCSPGVRQHWVLRCGAGCLHRPTGLACRPHSALWSQASSTQQR
mgnify:CR=1 FL=1